MKKLLLLAFAIQLSLSTSAYDKVTLVINGGTDNAALKAQIENTVSQFITSINQLQEENAESLQFTSLPISDEALRELNMLWQNEHFHCVEEEIVEPLITIGNGFQVRGIPLIVNLKGQDELIYQEAVISFDRNGVITSIYYTIDPALYSKLTKTYLTDKRREVTDIEQRMMILNYVEHFRTAYNQKDLTFLEQVFSNDALIISGHVIKTRHSELNPTGVKIEYIQRSKREYVNHLKKVFRYNGYVKVVFDDVLITAHPTLDSIYGVTVHQKWNSSHYSDEGYVFMVWDFRNPDEPQIHVRTWQPEFLNKKLRIDPRDVFTLGDFDL